MKSIIVFVFLLLVACQTSGRPTMRAVFFNQTEETVHVYDCYGKVIQKIPPGEIKKFPYPTCELLKIATTNLEYTYKNELPPVAYCSATFWGSEFKAVITCEGKIYLIGRDDEFDKWQTPKEDQPNGWPLVPIDP